MTMIATMATTEAEPSPRRELRVRMVVRG